MSKSFIWSSAVFVVFSFATLIVFFWMKEGSLQGAGSSMDRMLGRAGSEIAQTTDDVATSTSAALKRATDGDKST